MHYVLMQCGVAGAIITIIIIVIIIIIIILDLDSSNG